MRDKLKAAIEQAWRNRARAQGLDNPKTMKYRRAQLEFFMGAITAINAMDETPRDEDTFSPNVSVIWIINAMAGRPMEDA